MTEIEKIVTDIYAAYGTDSGILFGIKERDIVKAIVEFTINRIPKAASNTVAPVDNIVESEEKKSIAETFKELREIGSAWDDVICVCRGLMKDNPCELNCKEFHDESLTNSYSSKEQIKEVSTNPLK